MPMSKKYLANFVPGKYFHVYNRSNNKEDLFKTEKDKLIFLNKIKQYSLVYFDIISFCLLDNHFHLLIKIRSLKEIRSDLNRYFEFELSPKQRSLMKSSDPDLINILVTEQFRKLFISYALGLNKLYGRKGNLFQRQYKRIYVMHKSYLKTLVLYIHFNPMKHHLAKNIHDYEWSSYFELKNDIDFLIDKNKLIEIFGSKYEFFESHQKTNEYQELLNLYEKMIS